MALPNQIPTSSPSAMAVPNTPLSGQQPPSMTGAQTSQIMETSYAIGYHEALNLRLTGRHAKFFAQAFAHEYDQATNNGLTPDQSKDYATDLAGPYALALMAFLKENSDIITSAKLIPEAHAFAQTHFASYENSFAEYHNEVTNDANEKAELQRLEEEAEEKRKLEVAEEQAKYVTEQCDIAEKKGYTKGFSDGEKKSARDNFDKGKTEGHDQGYSEGILQGFEEAKSKDYDTGILEGKSQGYKNSGLLFLPLIALILGYFLLLPLIF